MPGLLRSCDRHRHRRGRSRITRAASRGRRREAPAAADRRASAPVPELTEDDIAWRIGASPDRPAARGRLRRRGGRGIQPAEDETRPTASAAAAPPARPPPAAGRGGPPITPAAAVVRRHAPRGAHARVPTSWLPWRDCATVLLVVGPRGARGHHLPSRRPEPSSRRGTVAAAVVVDRVPDRVTPSPPRRRPRADGPADPRLDAGAGVADPAADAEAHAQADRPPAPRLARRRARPRRPGRRPSPRRSRPRSRRPSRPRSPTPKPTPRPPTPARSRRRRIRQLRWRQHDSVRLRQLDRLRSRRTAGTSMMATARGSADPSHTYGSDGGYLVVLTVSGPGGNDSDTRVGHRPRVRRSPTDASTADRPACRAPRRGVAPARRPRRRARGRRADRSTATEDTRAADRAHGDARAPTVDVTDVHAPAARAMARSSRDGHHRVRRHRTRSTCSQEVTYTPDPDYNGPDSFTFTATSDGAAIGPGDRHDHRRPGNDDPTFTVGGGRDGRRGQRVPQRRRVHHGRQPGGPRTRARRP